LRAEADEIRDVDDRATLDRLHPIPFLVRIPDDRIDKNLLSKLLAEAEGILAWAVAGAWLWHRSGLGKPPEVDVAKDEWRSQMDQIGRFIEERCVISDAFRVAASVLYGAYKAWAEASGEHAATSTEFGIKVTGRGLQKRHTDRGWFYLGLGLVAEPG
jgi:putative DNA primase/helicase